MTETRGLTDYHLHTARCGHAKGNMEDYARRAASIGLAEIGFADHFPLLHIDEPSLSMNLEELPPYTGEVQRLGEGFPELRVRLGIEVDYIPETLDRVEPMLASLPFDYVMGSIHFIDGWGFDDPRYIDDYAGRDICSLWSRYFELLAQAAECGLFDILAHPDLVKKFGFRPDEDVTGLYTACIERIAVAGVVVEVNTAGLRKPVGEIYPGEEFLRMCRERDIPITLGSDAHRPQEVGEGFGEALRLLRRAGYDRITVFSARKRTELPI